MEWDFAQEIIKLQNKNKAQDELITSLLERLKNTEAHCDNLSNRLSEANNQIANLQC
mgnify:FL=1